MRSPACAPDGSERVPDLPITGDRDEAMNLLRPHHEAAVAGFRRTHRTTGGGPNKCMEPPWPSCPEARKSSRPMACRWSPEWTDLSPAEPGVVLAIYVADCGAIWLADRKTGAIGLLHSGKKGTEAIFSKTRSTIMAREFRHPAGGCHRRARSLHPAARLRSGFRRGNRRPGRPRRSRKFHRLRTEYRFRSRRAFTATGRNWAKPAA